MFMMSFVALQHPFACGYNCHSGGLGVVGSGVDCELWEVSVLLPGPYLLIKEI